jgi:UDP-N-acetylglucosamine 4,6-dehydratase/5-epimerase
MAADELEGKVVLVTGGTGSFGTAFITTILRTHRPDSVRVYSRDELKQYELEQQLGDRRARFLIGDVRDRERMQRALRGVDVVVHAAALKQVPACEYNPFEAVQTNVVGTENVVAAALDADVPKTLAISTDKAVNPVNLYGASKLCAEKIVVQGNAYAGSSGSRFSCVRYGNVVGSRGSVVPLFHRQALEGTLTITDERMTRFWITLPQAVEFVLASLERMQGGEVFVPRIPSTRIVELAAALAPEAITKNVGIRPGEKVHEVLVTADEARQARAFDDYIAIYPAFPFWPTAYPEGKELPDGFAYTSDTNEVWLDADEIRAIADVSAADA